MSRNASGTYTLPSGNPVVSGTLIEATWANTTLSDLASAMTDSLSRSGQGGMTAALRLFDGTSSVPGLAWGSETTTGWYRAGAGDMRLVITGSQVIQYLSTGVAITGTLSASGNTTLSGTLAVTGATTLTGALTVNGGIANNPTLSAGTANGVAYLNGSKVVTTGSAFAYDGTGAVSITYASDGVGFTAKGSATGTNVDATTSRGGVLNLYNTSATDGNTSAIGFFNSNNLTSSYISGVNVSHSGRTGALVFGIANGSSPTEGMRLTSTGLGIGTSSPSAKLHVVSGAIEPLRWGSTTSGYNYITHLNVSSGVVGYLGDGLSAVTGYAATDYAIRANQGNLLFATNGNNVRAIIDTSGNLLVGTTAQQTGGNGKLSVSGGSSTAATLTNNSNASAYTAEVFNYTTGTGAGVGRYFKFAMGSTPTQTGSIIGDGTNTAYNTSSDYRLKENITPMTGALALVMQQRPVTWTWKLNGNQGKGFIAHWLQEDGAGECVTGHKDAVDENGNPEYQGVDTSFLVATLTAAIQELKAEFDAYKATHP